ncbi:DMT family transporter, partial [Kerstersia sp.]|uniref:DMT family transporter n=1 Tax=Kerstersia sp. TaxID=1930783 RepID=UPI003F8E4CEE
LYVLLKAARIKLSFDGRLVPVLLLGVIGSGIPFLCYTIASLYIPAGYSAILNANTPLMSVLVGGLFFGEQVSVSKVLGIFAGLAGVWVLMQSGPVALDWQVMIGMLSCLISTVCYGTVGYLTRLWITRRGSMDNRLLAFGSQVGATLFLLPMLLVSLWLHPEQGSAVLGAGAKPWLALIALGFVCTSLAYILFFRLLAEVGPVRTTTVTFLIPLFGVLWGYLFLDEQLSMAHLSGGGLIALALLLVTTQFRRRAG